MKTVDAFVGDYTEALIKNSEATVYENLAPVIRHAMQQAHDEALEKAAGICFTHANNSFAYLARRRAAQMCGDDILALKHKKGE